MKFLVLFVTIVGVSSAQFGRPVYKPTYARNGQEERYAKVLKNDFELSPDGTYRYEYETDNGIAAQESGYPRSLGGNPPEVAETVQGTYSWTSPEGQFISIGYSADENGYHPVGSAIPTPPPIPDYILRSIEYIKAKNAQPGFKRF